MAIIKKSPGDVLVKDLVKGLMQQGVAEVDIKAGMAKAGIPDDMARSLVLRVGEELEVEGTGTQKSIARIEFESSLFEWGRDFEAKIEERFEDLSGRLDKLEAGFGRGQEDREKCLREIEAMKNDVAELGSSVKSFEMLAKEILKALKKT